MGGDRGRFIDDAPDAPERSRHGDDLETTDPHVEDDHDLHDGRRFRSRNARRDPAVTLGARYLEEDRANDPLAGNVRSPLSERLRSINALRPLTGTRTVEPR